jgi:hypothetical protein
VTIRRAGEIATAIINRCGGSKNGMVRCPCHDDDTASLSITVKNGKLLFNCFGGCSQERLIAKWVEWGLWGSSPSNAIAEDTSEEEDDEDTKTDDEAKRIDEARIIWEAATRTISDLANLREYFVERRGLSFVAEEARYLRDAKVAYKGRPVITGTVRAILMPIVNATTGEFQGCQATFVNMVDRDNLPDKDGKNKRRVYGELTNGMIKVSGKVKPDSPVAIAEGVEKAMAAAELSGFATVSAISAKNMANVVASLRGRCTEMIIAADNDKPGREAAEKAAQKSFGRPVRVAYPPEEHKDWDGALTAGVDIDELKRLFAEAGEPKMTDEKKTEVKAAKSDAEIEAAIETAIIEARKGSVAKKREINRLTKDLKNDGLGKRDIEALIEERLEQQAAPPEPPPVDIEALERSARSIIRCKNILRLFDDDIGEKLAGESATAKLQYLISRHGCRPIPCRTSSRVARPRVSRICAMPCSGISRARRSGITRP